MNHIAFFISDGTGITAESLGHSLLSRFSGLQVDQITLPYINTEIRAKQVNQRINDSAETLDSPPLVVMSVVDAGLRDIIKESNGLVLDMFEAFLDPMEKLFGKAADVSPGTAFGMAQTNYHQRIQAVNYVLENDDGGNIKNYSSADVILVGLSRSGKTPTCLYLGMHFGIRAANYPFTEDDLDDSSIPKSLQAHRNKLFGLLIEPERLASIREERYANSRYAALSQCEFETRQFKATLERHKLPYLNSTHLSIEELSTRIMDRIGIERRINA
ncbi:MAG: regulator of PEP synthase PpsR (kinase-PPPase family) [Cellvibrionaceae bacterium]|jgi:regulator of PEP synthase PpsR (kinase-PPPase family)